MLRTSILKERRLIKPQRSFFRSSWSCLTWGRPNAFAMGYCWMVQKSQGQPSFGWCWNLVKHGINYQPQLVCLPDFCHQLYQTTIVTRPSSIIVSQDCVNEKKYKIIINMIISKFDYRTRIRWYMISEWNEGMSLRVGTPSLQEWLLPLDSHCL